MTTTVPLDRCTAAVPMYVFDGPTMWRECGTATGLTVHDYKCRDKHQVRRATCPAHAPEPGRVGCRQCWDTIRTETPMTATPA